MGWKLSNFAESVLEQSCSDTDTTLYINADNVDLLPTLAPGDKAKAVLLNNSYKEIINVTAWSTDGTLTVERGQESTSARDWDAGTIFIHTPTAEILQNVLSATASVIFTGSVTNVGNLYTVNVGAGNTLPAFTDGELATFIIPAANTGAVTLRFTDGTTTTAIKDLTHMNGQALSSGDFGLSWAVQARYSSSADDWQLLSQTSNQIHASLLNDAGVPAVNRHRNGRLDFWNNGTSFASPVSGSETADGWLVSHDGTVGAFSVSRQSFTLGQTDVPGDPRYFIRWDQSSAGSGATIRAFRVKIPGVEWRNGDTAIRRVYLKADAARTVTARIIQNFGTGGSPSAEVVAGTLACSVTTAWQAFDLAVTLASIAGKTLGSNADDSVQLELLLPVNVTMTIDVANDDIRSGVEQGQISASFPVPWWQGGTGGSFDSVSDFTTSIGVMLTASYPDLVLVEALAGNGIVVRNNTGPAWTQRSIAVGAGLSVANADGTAGNPTVSLGTALTNYNADPLSVAELASVTGSFGTAAFQNTGTSGATIPFLNGNNTWAGTNAFSGAVSLSTTATLGLTVTSTDAGATIGPYLLLDRNSASPAASDVIGGLVFRGRDAAAAATDYATIRAGIVDTTDASEDGSVSVDALVAGVNTEHVRFSGGQVLVPAGSASVPAIAGIADSNTGLEFAGADSLFLVTGGTRRWNVESGGDLISSNGRIRSGSGSATTPGYNFKDDIDCGVFLIGANNIGLAVAGAEYIDISATRTEFNHDAQFAAAYGPTSVYAVGYRGAPVNTQNTAYTLVLTDAGHTIYHDEVTARVYTIPANSSVAFPIGTTIIIDNTGNSGAAGTITLSITTDTLRRGDGVAGTGSRTIAAGQVAAIRKTKSTEWVITGTFT